jgi:hypothetical protein
MIVVFLSVSVRTNEKHRDDGESSMAIRHVKISSEQLTCAR